MENFPKPVSPQEKQFEGGEQSFAKKMESAKQEVQDAIRSGDVKLALNAFLRLNQVLPTNHHEQQFDYAGSFTKDIMRQAIKSASAETATYEDVKSMVEVYLSLHPHFPKSHGGESFDYAGSYAKDIMKAIIKAARKEGAGDVELAKETLSALRPYLPTEHGGKEFDYASSYEKDIDRL
jgi:hypothetical protein